VLAGSAVGLRQQAWYPSRGTIQPRD